MNTETVVEKDSFQIGNADSPIDVAKFRAELERLTLQLGDEQAKRQTVETRNIKLTDELRTERAQRTRREAEAEVLMEVVEKLAEKLKD